MTHHPSLIESWQRQLAELHAMTDGATDDNRADVIEELKQAKRCALADGMSDVAETIMAMIEELESYDE